MADNFEGQVNVSGNQNNSIKSGIFSTMQYKQAQQQLNEFAFNDNGLLQNMMQQTQQILKLNKDLANLHDKMTKSERQRYAYELAQLRKIKKETQDLYDKGEASADDIIDLINQSAKSYNVIYNDNLKAIQRQISELEKKKDLNDDEITQLEYMKQLEDQILTSQIQQEHSTERNTENIKEYTNILKTNTNSWSKGMSQTLGSVSSTLGNLANMFNINKLANSGLNQFVSSKLDLQNQMMKDFGMVSKNEYLDFKNNLDDTLNSMGNLFNSSDLKTYMGNLSKMGITDTNLAESMAKSSMLASKYLGVSTETQEQLFKYMKRTNDYDMLDEHNKTITGILQAQLGVSREQLDIMSQEALASMDALAAAGVSPEAQETFRNQYVAMEASLTNAVGEDTAKSIMGVVSEFANSDLTNASSLVKKYGGNAVNMLQSLQNTGDVNSFVQALVGSAGNRGIISTNATENKTLQSVLGIDPSTQAAINSLIGNTEYLDNFNRALENRDIANPGAFVENTTEITPIDEISNMLDKFINGIDWDGFTAITMAAAAAQIASGAFDVIDKIGKLDFKSFFSNAKTSAGMLKNLGTTGKGLLAAGGGIFLGVSAANMISGAIESSRKKTESAEISSAENALKGTDLEGNSYAATTMGLSNAAEQSGGIRSMFSTVTRGLGTGLLGWTRDLATINQDDWAFMKESLSSRKSMTDEERERYLTAWTLLLISAGRQTDITEFANISKSELTAFMQSKGWTKDLMNRTVAGFNGTMTYPNKSLDEDQTYIDWSKLSLDGYHKNGKNYISKDNYHALLHKGEMVLDSEAADAYRKGFGIGGYDAVPWPITSRYNSNSSIRSGYHTGTDFGAASGTPVGAAIGGTVLNKSWGKAWGNHVIIHGDNGLYYLYAHFSRKAVNGGKVNTGQTIGYVGSTGNSTGPHLHFEVQKSASWARGNEVDPGPYVTSGLLGDSSAIQVSSPIANSDASFDVASSNNGSNISSNTSSRPIITKRVLPSAALSSGGVGGADLISNSVDNGINKIINYLNNVKGEQDVQREMLNTFSKANTVSSISG